jgi:Putative prokaryotic signal transducing protein
LEARGHDPPGEPPTGEDAWEAEAGAGHPAAQTAIISAKVGGLITIGTYGTRDEAEVVQGLLASAGIEASIRADDAGGAFPFVLSGGAQVLVDESDAAAASELLANRADET